MTRSSLSAVGAWSLTLGAALLLASSVLAVSAGDRAGLDADTLARSRGSNEGNKSEPTGSCNTYNNCTVCIKAGDGCTTCDVANYNVVAGGYVGLQKSSTAAQSCGNVYTGTCNANLGCDKQGGELGKCAQPPKVEPQPIPPSPQ